MQLILFRHGKATGIDDGAELTGQGRHEVRSTCERLRTYGIDRSMRVIHSGLRRASETAAIISEVLGVDVYGKDERFRPDADVSVAISLIENSPVPLLVVTHQPLVAHLTARLVEEREIVQFGTATAATLSNLSGRWTVKHVVEPSHE